MKKLFCILFIVVITAATTLPVQAKDTRACTKTSAQEIAALFDRWNASLATLDPDKMAALYTPEAVLLPTLSNKPRTNHEEIREYFVHFLEKKPQAEETLAGYIQDPNATGGETHARGYATPKFSGADH